MSWADELSRDRYYALGADRPVGGLMPRTTAGLQDRLSAENRLFWKTQENLCAVIDGIAWNRVHGRTEQTFRTTFSRAGEACATGARGPWRLRAQDYSLGK